MKKRFKIGRRRTKSVICGPPKEKILEKLFNHKKKKPTQSLKLKSVQVNRKPPASTFCFVDGEPSDDLHGYGNIQIRSSKSLRYKHPERDYYFSCDQIFHTEMDVEDVFNHISRNVLSNIEMGRSSVLFYVGPTRFTEEQNVLIGHPSLDEEDHQNGVLSWIVSDLLENKKQLLDISDLELRVYIAQLGIDQDVMQNCEHYNVTTRIDRDLESVRDILIYSQQRIGAFSEQKTLSQYRQGTGDSDSDSESDSDDEEGNSAQGLKKNHPSVIYEIAVKTVSGITTKLLLVQIHERHFRSVMSMVRRQVNTTNYAEPLPGLNKDLQSVQAAILKKIPGNTYGITVLGHGFQDKSRMCKRAMEIVHKSYKFGKRRAEMSVNVGPLSEEIKDVEKAMQNVKLKELSNGIRKDLISLITEFRDSVAKHDEKGDDSDSEEEEGEDSTNYKALLTQVITDTIPGMYQVIHDVRQELAETELRVKQKDVEKKGLEEQVNELEEEVETLKASGGGGGSGGSGATQAPEGWIPPEKLQQFISALDAKTQEERDEYEHAIEQWKEKCQGLEQEVEILQEDEDEEGIKNQLIQASQTNQQLRQAVLTLQAELEKKGGTGSPSTPRTPGGGVSDEVVKDLEEEISELEDEKAELEDKVEKFEESQKEHMEEIQRLKENIGDLERTAFARKHTGDTSAEQWEKMYNDKVKLQQDIYQVKVELHALKTSGVKVPTEEEKQKMKEAEKAAKKKKKKNRGSEYTDSEAEEDEDDDDGEEKVSIREVEELEEKLEEEREAKARVQEQLDELMESLGTMKTQLDSTQEKVQLYDEAIKKKTEMEEEMESLSNEKLTLTKKLGTIESRTRQKLELLKRENETIMERVMEQSSEFEEKINKQRNTEMTLKRSNQNLSKKVESYESRVKAITMENERQKSMLNQDVLNVKRKLSGIQESYEKFVNIEGRRNKIGKKKIEKLRGNYLSELEKLKIRFKKELYFKVKAYHKERDRAAFLRKAKTRQDQEISRLKKEGQVFKKRVDELEHKIRQMKKGTALFANNPAVVGKRYLSTPNKRKRGSDIEARSRSPLEPNRNSSESAMSPNGLLRNEKLKKRIKGLEEQLFELQLKYNGVRNRSPVLKRLKVSEEQQKSMLLQIKKLVYFVEKFKAQKLKYQRKCTVYKKLIYERDTQLNTIKSISTSPPRHQFGQSNSYAMQNPVKVKY